MSGASGRDRSPLVGRERELDRLTGQLAAAEAGRGGAIAVIGEPGIGKTALVAAATSRAHDAGALVLWGRCSRLGAQSAWGPVAQALAALLDEGVIDASMAAACGGGLLAILPEAAHLVPQLNAPAGADPETVAFAVARATTRLLRQVCLRRRCVLVIDDVHDADLASLRVLTRLAQEVRTMPLTIVMTAREGELGARQDVAEVAELTRDLESLRIGPLAHADSGTLVRHVAPGLAGDLVDRVLGLAEGNPLYLRELAALLGASTTAAGAPLPIPVGVKASIRSRLERLPPDARRLVGALAVVGGQGPIFRAAALAEVPTSAASAALAVGIAVPAGTGAVRLSHPLVIEVAYADLEDADRQALHRRAAAIAGERAADDHDAGVEQVRHLAAGGSAAEAIAAAVVVARAAELRAADDEAVSVLEVAATAGEQAGVDDRLRAEVAVALGRAQLRCGRSEQGVASCVRAAALAERVGDVDLVARAALARGSVFRFGHVDRGLVQALQAAVDRRAGREDDIQARLLARLAAAEQPCAEPQRPVARAHQAFTLARRLGDERVLLDVLHDGMAACVDVEDPRTRVVANTELRDLARRLRAPWYEMRALNRLVFDHAEVGDMAAADADIDALDVVARSFAHPRHQWRVAMLRAMRALSDGRWAAADRHADEAIALGSDDPLQPIARFGHRLGRLRAQERADELVQFLDAEGDLMLTIPDGEAVIGVLRCAARARAGDLHEARRLLPVAQRSLVFDDVTFMCMFAETAVTLDDGDACALIEPLLEKNAHRFLSGGPMFVYVCDAVERYLGLVLSRRGESARASALLESACARLRAAGSLPYLARANLDLAALLRRRGALDRAAALEAEAAELAERLELADLRDRRATARMGAGADDAAPFVPRSPGFTLVRDGEAWAVSCRGRSFRLRDTRGLRILAQLIERAGEDVHALDLVDAPPAEGGVDRGDAGELLDARARAEYRARLVDLRDDLADAERRGDLGWIDRLRTESEAIQTELSRAFARDGRARRGGSAAERARSAVTRRVREAIARIAEHDPELGDHLAWAVTTGVTCSYRP